MGEPVTIKDLREMCEGLADGDRVYVVVPGSGASDNGEDDWRSVEFDISAHLWPDRCLVIEVPDSEAEQHGE